MVTPDEIRRRYADMAASALMFMPEAYWDDRHRYALTRTREELNDLLRFGHIIPVSRGWTRAYVDEHYPGWTWNGLVGVLRAAGVLVDRGGSPPCCAPGVRAVWFDSEDGWLVEWENDRHTCGLAPPGSSGQDVGP